MTRDEIVGMLAEVDFQFFGKQDWDIFDKYEAFAKLVAEKEREACAKVADEYANGLERNYSEIIADLIRARSNT